MPTRVILTQAEHDRIAQLERWRGAWLEREAWVRLRAEERSIAWQEHHIPERFQDVMPWQLPPRLRRRYHRQEIKYAERLDRADRHAAKADACTAAIRRIRAAATERRPKQQALFLTAAAGPRISPLPLPTSGYPRPPRISHPHRPGPNFR